MRIDKDSYKKAINLISENSITNDIDTDKLHLLFNDKNNSKSELMLNILLAIRKIDNNIGEIKNEEILEVLKNNKHSEAFKQYFVFHLFCNKGLNIFLLILSINDENVFWSTYHYYINLFEEHTHCEMSTIIACIKKVYKIVKRDMTGGAIINKISKYFIKFNSDIDELMKIFINEPSQELQCFTQYIIGEVSEMNMPKVNEYIDIMLISGNDFLISTACKYCSNLAQKDLQLVIGRIDSMCKLCDDVDNQNVISNTLEYLMTFLSKMDIEQDDVLEKKIEQLILRHINDSEMIKFSVALVLQKYVIEKSDFSKKLLNDLFNTSYSESDNIGLFQQLDLIASKIIENGQSENVLDVLDLLKQSYYAKPIVVHKVFDITCSQLFMNFINEVVYYSYKCLSSTEKQEISFGMSFINYIAFTNNFENINFCLDNSFSKIMRIMNVIIVFCPNARFVSFVGIRLAADIKSDEEYQEYEKMYIDKVYYNYPGKTIEQFNTITELTSYQKLLKKAVILENEKRLKENITKKSIPDLRPSNRRILEYRLAQDKKQNELIKESEKESVLYKLIRKQTIKYGKRYSSVITNNGYAHIEENSFHKFEYEYELPIVYLLNPLKHYLDEMELYRKEEGDTHEANT
ncbi:TPA: hypothetical protein PTV44_002387 [Clostridium botulinum]|nr:hypothetical protein [Clostridium botulinum]